MLHKILRFINNPFYRKVDSVKDWYYLFRSNLFRLKHGLDFTEVNDFGYDQKAYESKKHGNEYVNGSYYYFKLMLDYINVNETEYQFIDIGSGKGRICFEVARDYHFSHVIGVEYEGSLVETANQNKKLLANDAEFIWHDASNYLLPDAKSVVFIFNSFDELVMEKFLKINMENLKRNKSFVLYTSNIHKNVFVKNGANAIYEDDNRRLSIFKF